jgi:hypothetical protein
VRPDGGAIMPLVCQPPQSICESQCVDTSFDPLHCGGCNKPCGGGKQCLGGECVCPTGLMDCNGVCADLMSDSGNCNGCGNTCNDGRVCDRGACVCPPNFGECDGVCVDFDTDPEHCGSCPVACSPLQSCEAKICGCGDLDACPGGTSGYCSRTLERHCCEGTEMFCDVADGISFPGGCLPNGLDCRSIFPCGSGFAACATGGVGYCSTTDAPSCCDTTTPLFCDSVDGIGYDGGCWESDVRCNSISACGTVIFACRDDRVPYCASNQNFVCCAPNEIFCDSNDAIGYGGGCWPTNIDCNTITDCGGNYAACPPGTGRPNCTTNVCE